MGFFLNLSFKEKVFLAILLSGALLCIIASLFWGGMVFGSLFSFFYVGKVLDLVNKVKENFFNLSWLEQLVLIVAGLYFLSTAPGFFIGILLGLGLKRVLS